MPDVRFVVVDSAPTRQGRLIVVRSLVLRALPRWAVPDRRSNRGPLGLRAKLRALYAAPSFANGRSFSLTQGNLEHEMQRLVAAVTDVVNGVVTTRAAERKVLILAPQFPPCSLAGVHRARFLATYFRRYGWEPIVLTVRADAYERDVDPALLRLLDPTVRVDRVSAWPVWLTRRFGLGDITIRAWRALSAAADRIARRDCPAVVFTTVLPTYHSLIAARLARRYRLPLVLDYQDPWVTEEGAAHPIWSKRGVNHRLATLLEPRVLRWTNHVTAVSDGTWKLIRQRHPILPESHFTTLPIGGDPADFTALCKQTTAAQQSGEGLVRFAYVGTIWPQVMGTVRALLDALLELKVHSPAVYARVRFEFVGTQAGHPDQVRPQVQPLAEQMGVGDAVRESPHRVPYLDALRTMTVSQVLLILGSNLPHYSASKLFPCLMSGKPVLAIIHEDSEVNRFGRACGGVKLVNFNSAGPVRATVTAIAEAVKQLAADPAGAVGVANLEPIRHLFADRITAQFAAIFDSVVSAGFTGPRW